MDETSLAFEYFGYIPLGLLLCSGAFLIIQTLKKRNAESLARFAGDTLLPRLLEGFSTQRRRVKAGLVVAGALLIFTALARPQKGFERQEVVRRGIDILIALDTSKSMLATDTAPNRLERAKMAIDDFIKKLDGDRVGLIPFSGSAFLMVPLTLDYDIVLDSLHEIDTNVIPRGGTNISAAIDEARRALEGSNKEKIVVLISDGEDLEEEGLEAASRAASDGIKIFTIGVGTTEGELIPMNSSPAGSSFVKDKAGNVVKSSLDEKTLNEIAETTSASYFPLGPGGEGLTKVYAEKLKLMPKHDLAQRTARKPIDHFEWPLFFAFLALVVEFWLKERPSGAGLRLKMILATGHRLLKQTSLLALVFILVSCGSDPSKLYNKASYREAAEGFKKLADQEPDNAGARYNAGASEYKGKNYDESITQFQEALRTEDLKLQEMTYFNLGDAFYRKGQGTEKSDPSSTVSSWKEAVRSYENALKLNPSNEDAKYNKEFVKKKLEDLLKQNPPPSPSPQPNENDKQQEQQQQQKQQEQQNQESLQNKDDSAQEKEKKEEDQSTEQEEEKTIGKERQQSTPTPSAAKSQPVSREDMTKEEAEQLLQALRNEEIRVLPFDATPRHNEDDVKKDW